ncbi:peptidyl arginine deiminase 2 [Phyllostomus discolor]|uniref:Peptidyl arginine deiminase 2 n=1 Tax=Phyllostomus discolor TaxID=89673 RepID=A0A834AJA3_9CHIR|nr:peptidyl arginine deiminase 2 [Phyllostomus discolor]
MLRDRTVRLLYGSRVKAVYVLGTHLWIDVYSAAPAGAQTFSLKHSELVQVEVVCDGEAEEVVTNGKQRWPLSPSTTLRLTMSEASTEASSDKVTVNYYEEEGNAPINQAGLFLTAIEISLDVDADRDGVVEKNNPKKASWTWGPEGQGAILLVNCDRETPWLPKEDLRDEKVYSKEDLKDMSQMILRTKGPDRLPAGYEIVLYINMSDSDKVGVFYVDNPFFGQRYMHILGRQKLYHVVKYTGGSAELLFFVEGLRFPDEGFPGLVSIHVSLLEYMAEEIPLTPIFTDTVVFRIAPWIMTPNILPPVSVMKDNYLFLKEVKSLVEKTNCDLKVCFQYINRGDRWIQDEIEFGYIEAPHKGFPVVLDSPRDGNLKDFPVKQLLGPDFGYVTREPLFEPVTSLDSFGNLEVSPPVTVNGKTYPLGRILIGSSFPLSGGRRMTKVVRDFLQAQQVQAPIELYSDWLTVGHVDEFMTFIPIPGTKQFRMLMASTSACYQLFREKQKEGHGEAIMFKGPSGDAETAQGQDESPPLSATAELEKAGKCNGPDTPPRAGRAPGAMTLDKSCLAGMSNKRITINKILSNESLVQENQYFQRCLDWNRDILKKELGLTEQDIIDLPALFKMDEGRQARAYFPNMVNMIVLDKDLGIPKPFGPQVEDVCCLETHVRSLLEPLGLCCTFIDDISAYHKFLGEVHCGTNVRRKPFPFKWWHMVP